MNFKLFLWKIGFIDEKKCPFCKKRLTEKLCMQPGRVRYVCETTNCKFNNEGKN